MRLTHARARVPSLRCAAALAVLGVAGCTGDFTYRREIDRMTDQVEREEITTSGMESFTSRYGGTLWVECRGTELSSYLIVTTRIDPRLPTSVRVRLDDGAPFEPEGWKLGRDRGRVMFHFDGRTRTELFSWLDSTKVMMVGIYGHDPWGGELKTVFPLKTRGFRRAARKLSCVT